MELLDGKLHGSLKGVRIRRRTADAVAAPDNRFRNRNRNRNRIPIRNRNRNRIPVIPIRNRIPIRNTATIVTVPATGCRHDATIRSSRGKLPDHPIASQDSSTYPTL